ncbi:MAG: myosin-like coiled-coil protein-domain-containing protein [Piptocephalis tieghemiana]|nr:MAG: myosin-like coiled-coil protein-domain-containing protein [Piptocephalis tieghemiana]
MPEHPIRPMPKSSLASIAAAKAAKAAATLSSSPATPPQGPLRRVPTSSPPPDPPTTAGARATINDWGSRKSWDPHGHPHAVVTSSSVGGKKSKKSGTGGRSGQGGTMPTTTTSSSKEALDSSPSSTTTLPVLGAEDDQGRLTQSPPGPLPQATGSRAFLNDQQELDYLRSLGGLAEGGGDGEDQGLDADFLASTSPFKTAERAEELHQKYIEAWTAWKHAEREVTKERRVTEQARKEREAARVEAIRSTREVQKITGLCRALQKENKKLDLQLTKLQIQEQEKEEQLAERFEETLAEIDERLRKHEQEKKEVIRQAEEKASAATAASSSSSSSEAAALRARIKVIEEEKIMLMEQLQGFQQQYAVREKLFMAQCRSREVDVDLTKARLAREREKADLHVVTSNMLRSKIASLQQTEAELRSQLTLYVEKFKQVEETLNRSNELFANFRREMEQMSQKTKKLEKDNQAVKAKSEASRGRIAEMADMLHKKDLVIGERDQQLKNAEKRRALLEGLSRTLQRERDAARQELNASKAEISLD